MCALTKKKPNQMTEMIWKGQGIVKVNVSSSSPMCRAHRIYFSDLVCHLVWNSDIPLPCRDTHARARGQRTFIPLLVSAKSAF